MRVREICTRVAKSCGPDTNLADAGWTMWDGDCGVLPVVDETGKVVGVITDRDICMGVATKHRPAREIAVREVINSKVHSCQLNDDVRDALKTMRSAKVRRLPVMDAEGKLQAVLSLNDVALAARPDKTAKPTDITYEDLALTLKSICEHRAPAKEQVEKRTLVPTGAP